MAPADSFSLLMVEDDLIARDLIVQMIKVRFPGCTVYTAGNGREGLEVFKQETPQLVVTDINMPVLNGVEMARQIRALNADTQFLVLTAYGDEQFRKSFTEVGFCSFLRKPIDFQQLFDAIQNCFTVE